MKIYRRILLLFVFFGLALCSNAQSFAIKGGLNLANMSDRDNMEIYSDDYSMHPGFHIGGFIGIPLNDFLSLETGIIYQIKGMNSHVENGTGHIDTKTNLNYLDLPLTLNFWLEMDYEIKIYAAAGPYVGFGLKGTRKEKTFVYGITDRQQDDIAWGADGSIHDFRRTDLGLTFGGGAVINSVYLGFSYDLGMINIAASQENGRAVKNRVLRLSLGLSF